MKSVFIANSSWYLKNFRSSTIKIFSDNHEVTCMYPALDEEDNLKGFNVRKSPFYLEPASTNPIKELYSILTLGFNFIKDKPDIVYSFNPKTNLYALIVCWIMRIPCIPNVSGVGVASQLSGVKGRLYRYLMKFYYRRAHYVFFQNIDDLNNYVNKGWVKAEQAEVIAGSGVDLSEFKPHERNSSSLRFLMAARLIGPKGVVEYIRAARKLSAYRGNCSFFLAGVRDTSSRAISEEFLESINLDANIRFLGHVKDMPDLLKSIDVVVLPSYYPEGVPRSLIEAAAAGKIIITTNTPGCREVVVEGLNGYFVDIKSEDSLVEVMEKLLDHDDTSLDDMQRASRELAVNKFNEKIIINRYLEIADNFG